MREKINFKEVVLSQEELETIVYRINNFERELKEKEELLEKFKNAKCIIQKETEYAQGYYRPDTTIEYKTYSEDEFIKELTSLRKLNKDYSEKINEMPVIEQELKAIKNNETKKMVLTILASIIAGFIFGVFV